MQKSYKRPARSPPRNPSFSIPSPLPDARRDRYPTGVFFLPPLGCRCDWFPVGVCTGIFFCFSRGRVIFFSTFEWGSAFKKNYEGAADILSNPVITNCRRSRLFIFFHGLSQLQELIIYFRTMWKCSIDGISRLVVTVKFYHVRGCVSFMCFSPFVLAKLFLYF